MTKGDIEVLTILSKTFSLWTVAIEAKEHTCCESLKVGPGSSWINGAIFCILSISRGVNLGFKSTNFHWTKSKENLVQTLRGLNFESIILNQSAKNVCLNDF